MSLCNDRCSFLGSEIINWRVVEIFTAFLIIDYEGLLGDHIGHFSWDSHRFAWRLIFFNGLRNLLLGKWVTSEGVQASWRTSIERLFIKDFRVGRSYPPCNILLIDPSRRERPQFDQLVLSTSDEDLLVLQPLHLRNGSFVSL